VEISFLKFHDFPGCVGPPSYKLTHQTGVCEDFVGWCQGGYEKFWPVPRGRTEWKQMEQEMEKENQGAINKPRHM